MPLFNEYRRLENKLRAIERLDKDKMTDVEYEITSNEYNRIWRRIHRLNTQMS